jgi:phosphate-selective porin
LNADRFTVNDEPIDNLFMRRLRPTFQGAMDENWQGTLQLDFGQGVVGVTDNTTVRWCNFQYTGIEQTHVTVGSFKTFFSREFLTLGPHVQLIERTAVGDNNFGNPEYLIGIGWDHMLPDRKLAYYVNAGAQDQEQGAGQMTFRSPTNAPSGVNQGFVVAGRIDFAPIGEMEYDVAQLGVSPSYDPGDFHTDAWLVMLSTGAYGWWNDGDSNNTSMTTATAPDLQQAYGIEFSGGVRGHGFSADAEYQFINGELYDGTYTDGLYLDGATDLNKFSLNGGYMLPGTRVELVSGWMIMDASNYEVPVTATTVGINWYIKGKADIRYALTYAMVENTAGSPENNGGIVRLQGQFVW